jgi:hypothetical protein
MDNYNLTGIILKKAYEVHTALGAGLLESTYYRRLYLEALNNQNYSETTGYKPLIINTF